MMHHSHPGEQSAWHAERSIPELNCLPHFQSWSGCQACYPLRRLEMRWRKGGSHGLAAHSMGEDRGHGHIRLGASLQSESIHLPPALALLPSAAIVTEVAAAQKPCWWHCLALATLPGSASLHWTQWLTWLPADFIPCGWNRQENEMDRVDLPFVLLLHCNHIFHNRNIPENKRNGELNVWTGWQAEHTAMSQGCQQHPTDARLVSAGRVCLSPYMG